MKDEVKVQIAVLLENTVTTICFTILSIIFERWWIIFFALIFYTTCKWRDK